MAIQLPPIPNNPGTDAFVWRDWFFKVSQILAQQAAIAWTSIDFSGSNLTSIQTRRHNDLQLIQGGNAGEYYHLTQAQYNTVSTLPVFGTMATQDANNVAITGGTISGIAGLGTVTSVSGTAPVSVATGTTTPVISMASANTSTDGYLTSTDWNTFNSKLSAQVYPGAGIANSTGTAWGTSYGVSGTGSVALTSNPVFATDITVNGIKVGKGFGSLSGNTAVGNSVLLNASLTGNNNSAYGNLASRDNTTGSSNNSFGFQALRNNTTGNNNSAFGLNSLVSNTTGSSNSGFGVQTLLLNQTGNFNVAVGQDALNNNVSGSHNVAIGVQALLKNTTNQNVAIGNFSLTNNTTGTPNVGIGYQALGQNTTGSSCVALGTNALYNNTTGSNNFGLGAYALESTNTGGNNIVVGTQAMRSNTIGDSNVALGNGAMYYSLSGNSNHAIGRDALFNCNTGNNNVAIGRETLYATTSGSGNTALGHQSARYHADGATALTTPANSVYIGFQARGFNNSDSNSIVIGANAIGTGANATVIGNSSTTQARVFGALTANSFIPTSSTVPTNGVYLPAANAVAIATNSTRAVYIDSSQNVGIGSSSPTQKLELLDGNVQIRNAGTPSVGTVLTYGFNFRANNQVTQDRGIIATIKPYLGTAADNDFGIAFQTQATTAGGLTTKALLAPSGGFSLGAITDPGAGNLNVTGVINGGYIAHAAGTTAMAFRADNVVRVTPNANATYTTTVPAAGAICVLSILTSGTTSYTITFGTGFKSTGTLATGTVTAQYFNLTFVSDGTNLIETGRTIAIA
jgi:hypothetical protein